MPKCTFCQKQYEVPRGLTLVNVVGKISYFCSSKCRKNAEMKRKKRKWTIPRPQEEKKALLAEQAEAEEKAKETIQEPEEKVKEKIRKEESGKEKKEEKRNK